MFNFTHLQGLVTNQVSMNANSLTINDQKKIYKKILANLMLKNEVRALELISELKEKNIQPLSKDQELAWLNPWPCTLIESAKSMGAYRARDALNELVTRRA